jgi:hypothetical protein
MRAQEFIVEAIKDYAINFRNKDLLQERDQRRTRIMYHGTSSAFLSSILKNGLIPDSGNKMYGSSDGEFHHSLGGVYLTSREETAMYAADEAAVITEKDPILITVQYVVGSGGLDEDDVFKYFIMLAIENVFNDNFRPLSKEKFLSNVLNPALNRTRMILTNPKNKNTETFKTRESVKKFFTTFYSLIQEYEIDKANGKHDDFYERTGWRNELDYIVDLVWASDPLRNAITLVIESAKDSSRQENVRVTRPIKYQGKTRILSIKNIKTSEVYYPRPKNNNLKGL